MNTNLSIRKMTPHDLAQAKSIIDDNQMFPSEYLDEMVQPFFSKESQESWFVVEQQDSKLIAVAYCAPERMTEGTWNLLLIAVLKSHQGQGIGAKLMRYVEKYLVALQARVLLVETSGLEEYALTREFYPKCDYKQIALIPDYYDQGDDKVVFWKSLG